MSKKIIAGMLPIVFFSICGIARAQIVISEFMSDPESGAEWVELANISSSEVNLAGWNWTELASPGTETEHESSPKSLSGTVPASGMFVFEMNSALNNTGDSIGLYQGAVLEDRVTFGKVNGYAQQLDAPAKGTSGAYIAGSWETNQEATKGGANPGVLGSGDGGESEANSPLPAPSTAKKKIPASTAVRAEVSAPDIAYVGIPLQLRGRAMKGSEQAYKGKYFWNFGDGDFRDVKVISVDTFTHTYFYPGEYALLFEYYPNYFAEIPDVSEQRSIKVIIPEIAISRTGDERDFFVELSNESAYSVDVSNWSLYGNGKNFAIPKHTVIGSHKTLMISGRTSGFTVDDKNDLVLLTPTGEAAFRYASSPVVPVKADNVIPEEKSEEVTHSEPVPSSALIPPVPDGEVPENKTQKKFPPLATFGGLTLFTGSAAYVAYVVRRKKDISPS